MKIIKAFFRHIWQIFLNLIIPRRKGISPIARRFCFLLVTIIAAFVAVYIHISPSFKITSTTLYVIIGVLIYFAFSLRMLILIALLTSCLSMPGIYYMETNDTSTKAQMSVVNAYGSIVQGTFDITTSLSSGALEDLANDFDNETIKNIFLSTDNEIKNIQLSIKKTDAYQYSDILKKNLFLLLITFSTLLSAIVAYICVVFSHFEAINANKHKESL